MRMLQLLKEVEEKGWKKGHRVVRKPTSTNALMDIAHNRINEDGYLSVTPL